MQQRPKPRDGVEAVIECARAVARFHGYALGVHGTLVRDIDLIAAPWAESCSSAEELAEAVRGAVGGYWRPDVNDEHDEVNTGSRPALRAHGRRAFSIIGVLGTYIDLSVMPRTL